MKKQYLVNSLFWQNDAAFRSREYLYSENIYVPTANVRYNSVLKAGINKKNILAKYREINHMTV